jgi:hypothetical protein
LATSNLGVGNEIVPGHTLPEQTYFINVERPASAYNLLCNHCMTPFTVIALKRVGNSLAAV